MTTQIATSVVGRRTVTCVAAMIAVAGLGAQVAKPTVPPVEKVGDSQFRIGQVRIDTSRREVSVSGTVNAGVKVLEFIANTRSKRRAYESAVTLDADAIAYNAALLLIGLDPSRARGVPTRHFDPTTPEGDLVDIWLDCPRGECQHLPVERLMYDQEKKEALSGGTWVYTGSAFLPDGRYMADDGGVIIGFVHDPSSIIEYTGTGALNRFGAIVPNPTLGLPQIGRAHV